MTGIGIHFQGTVSGWANELCNAQWQKVMDPGDMRPFRAGINTMGRIYVPDGEANAWVMQGAAGAHTWFNRVLPGMNKGRSWITAWEGPNEPPVQNLAQRAALAAFTIELGKLMHAAGLKLVGLCLSVGWPDIGTAAELGPALAFCDYIGLHEYSAPHMQDRAGELCLRYRRTVAEWKAAGFATKPILITELGIDGGVAGRPGCGWRTYMNETRYAVELDWYAREMQKDGDMVQGATVFTASPAPNWRDFEVTQALAELVARDNAVRPATPPPQPPSVTEQIIAAAQASRVLFVNPDASLLKAMTVDGFAPRGNETDASINGVDYVLQLSGTWNDGEKRAYYCKRGEWTNVQKVTVP